ncbi:MAG: hypothetical protein CVV64_02985 [Candidatus Wallbacteria bacterium HGW-Wallbacteria-1]|uniref:Aminoacyl-tRNA synthetase class Ia domain-containing protein n=1 Tax=Candidatus Wallbacteria bacterium HGW-Wallbacteria-1 TaxID=2013854 RepID=A0A2N1PTI1_9BACT|nr:MAG: hypothetical protein CVV64_02985 [Candidatus Wallbacteria bacterium HGW-Wallbacteria-1]
MEKKILNKVDTWPDMIKTEHNMLNFWEKQQIFEKLRLKNRGKQLLYRTQPYTHSYPHCWRCSSELLFRLVDEWFISMDPWREDIKGVARQINWIPSYGMDLELDWLNNMSDWMISKKRFWGLALPIWVCEDCGNFEVLGSSGYLPTWFWSASPVSSETGFTAFWP